jgi:predicted nucleotide-binding protein
MTKEKAQKPDGQKRSKISQTLFPVFSLEKALGIAKALWEFYGGTAEPHQIALALKLSPTSGHWRMLCGASIAYGLTEGGYNVKEMKLAPIGKAIVAPTFEGEYEQALIKAILQPQIMKTFFEKYDKKNFPPKEIGENVLHGLGLPKERIKQSFEIISENGNFVGVIKETKTGFFVSLSTPSRKNIEKETANEPELELEDFARQISDKPEHAQIDLSPKKNNRVFISHGKNKKIVEQLKEIIKFGKYEPVVSVESETTSKPVPDKVLDDMRSCSAGIINIHSEGELLDNEGKMHIKLNDNVLIEIGAAMALYGINYILLVQKGVNLPSNLQGLYRCEYEGEKLDYEATMKLLKTFNQFNLS